MSADPQTTTEIEAAVFRRFVAHLQQHPEVQNIDLMILADFCRNCLGKWYRAEAEARGLSLSDEEARQHIYGMPYGEWKAAQPEATPAQLEAFAARQAARKARA